MSWEGSHRHHDRDRDYDSDGSRPRSARVGSALQPGPRKKRQVTLFRSHPGPVPYAAVPLLDYDVTSGVFLIHSFTMADILEELYMPFVASRL